MPYRDKTIGKIQAKVRREKIKHDPILLERSRKQSRDWYHKHKHDVGFREKLRLAERKQYLKSRQDPMCVEQSRMRARKYHAKNKNSAEFIERRKLNSKRFIERFPNRQRESVAKLKLAVMSKLGGICKLCGFTDARALQIDHVFGGGLKERREFGPSQHQLHRRVLADRTGKYQLLCANCNWIKRHTNNELPKFKSTVPLSAAIPPSD